MNITFEPYSPARRIDCLSIFDANCPRFFAPNERIEYEQFLDGCPEDYLVCRMDGDVIGAFGLLPEGADARLSWIMLDPDVHGAGIGSRIVEFVRGHGRRRGVSRIHIAASHLSAPFFARFGAVESVRTVDGWGPGMHRVDMTWNVAEEGA